MKLKVISAIVMIALIIPIIAIGEIPFKILAIFLGVTSMYEIINIKKKEKKFPIILKIISYILIGLLILYKSIYSLNSNIEFWILSIVLLVYLLPVLFINNKEKYNISDALYLIGATLFFGVAFTSFVLIRNTDLMHFIYIILITIFTDMFAMFTGNFIGKHKLCEKVSPNKTIEGAIGGSFVGTIIASMFYVYIINPNIDYGVILLITFMLSAIGQIGDLFFSSIKRHFEIKDFSNLIPGHGGILDRVDSLIFVAITYMFIINIL